MGVECMGCGMQRAVIHLMKGEFLAAFYLYPAIYTLILMFGLLLVHLRFDFSFGARMLKYLFFLNVLIILVHYVYKLQMI